MKVYIVEAMRAEAWESNTWIVKVFDSSAKAEGYKEQMLKQEEGLDYYDSHIYMISEKDVE